MHALVIACQLALALGAGGKAPGGRPQLRTAPRATAPRAMPAPARPETPESGAPPADELHGLVLEGGAVVPDLRAVAAEAQRRKERLTGNRVGRAYLAPPRTGEPPVVDWAAELGRLLALVHPGGGPAPARLSIVTTEAGPGWQLAIEATPGFAERAKAAAGKPDAPLGLEEADGGFAFRVDGAPAPARGGEDGWLRVADTADLATTVLSAPTFEGPLARWVAGDVADAYFVKGRLWRELLRHSREPQLAAILASTRMLTAGVAFASDGSSRFRVCVDAPALVQLGGAFRRADLGDALTPSFGSEATAFATVALPPALLQGFLGAAERSLDESGAPPLPPALAGALARMDGRLGLVSFGWPGDLALGFGMQDAPAALALVPALEGWLRDALAKLEPRLADVVASARAASGAPPSFVLRPDPALAGVRVGAVGRTVLVATDEGRLAALASAGTAKGPPPEVAGPLTPLVRATVARPAVLTGYMVASGDGSIGTILAWAARLAEPRVAEVLEALPSWVRASLRRLPLLAALAGVESLDLYDVAASLDVSGSVLVLEASSSEL